MEAKSLDKISLFANDGEMNKHYLVAESFMFSDQELKALQNHQRNSTLTEQLKSLIRDQQDSILKTLASSKDELNELMARNASMAENNVGYLVSYGQETNRVLAIYNTQRLIDFVEKRQLNSNASGEEGLLHKPESMAFHVDPLSKEAWKTRLQGSSTS
jgi:hypothetical protein